MTRLLKVALLIEQSSDHARGLIRGISAFSRAKGPWRLHLIEQLRVSDIRRFPDAWESSGVIAAMRPEILYVESRALSEPVIHLERLVVLPPPEGM